MRSNWQEFDQSMQEADAIGDTKSMSYPSDETIRMLRNVRDYAFTIYTRAQWAKADIEIIQQRPDWETMAESELEEALRHMNEATVAIKSALNRLRNMPVEPRQEG